MVYSKKNEHRCSCGRLLFKGYIGDGCVEIKCKRCGIIACFDGAIDKQSESTEEKSSKSGLVTGILIFLGNFLMLPMVAYAAMYSPGETLDPSCLPTDANCGVVSPVFVSSGVASAPAFSATSTAATSTFSGDVAFDSNVLYIDSVNNRVGIGTTTPSTQLVISGDSFFQGLLTQTGGTASLATTTITKLLTANEGVALASSSPLSTANTLYNLSGSLYWGGKRVDTGSYNYTTGWISGGQVTIGTPSNTINISAGSAQIVSYTNPSAPEIKIISWNATTSVAHGLSGRSAWVGVQDNGSDGAQFIFSAEFTPDQMRSTAVLARFWDNSGNIANQITTVGDYERPAWGLGNAFQDFILNYGSWNISGNVFSTNGANLLLDKSSGQSYRYHAEDTVGSENIHNDIGVSGISSYNYHIQGNSTTTAKTALDPDTRDNGSGGTVAVTKNKFTRQEVYMFPVSGTVHVLYGQTEYSSLAEAETSGEESLSSVNKSILDGSIHRSTIIMKKGITDLEDAINSGTAKIITIANANGGVASGGNIWSAGAYNDIYYAFGNVGIGTTTPDDTLAVQGLDGYNIFDLYTSTGIPRLTVNAGGQIALSTSTYTTGFNIATSTLFGARTLYINVASNLVGIGTSSPVDTLQVVGDVRVGTGTTGCVKDADGTVIAGVCSSDQRLKTNVTNAMSVLDKLKGLRFVTYNWNETAAEKYSYGTEATQYGLIADEVEKLFPELIHTDDKGYKTLDYSTLSLYGLNGIHELAGIADQSASMVDADGHQTFVGRFFSRLANWLADKANGITRLFAKEIYADKLCLADGDETICLTAADIKSLGKRTSVVVPNDSVADTTSGGGEVDASDVEVSDFEDIASTTEETEVSEATDGEEDSADDSQTTVSDVSEDAVAAEGDQDISEEENPEPEPSVVTEPPIEENSEGTDVSTIAEDELSQ